ncbi:RteC domain-containing protein [Pedobacter sp. V48]|uniref:RteC domain-containing protein n=1 Tax=Pedobacter sp. V48 TaxID=509635 RepID=UPI0003E55EB3|nr:RteC domain-containing protein [Pedobacter sp. V48]ETZ19190.1 hypothetical protein N824_10640 [Pedobacter sp. V48]
MNFEIYEKLHVQFTDALADLPQESLTPVKLLSEQLAISQEFLKKMRKLVSENPFSDADKEIDFFKHIKPKFYAQKIFQFELYGLEMNQPVGPKDTLLSYYNNELTYIARFHSLHASAYQYYRTGGSEMDHLYFVRGARPPIVQIPETTDTDPLFSTPMDHLFARFIAYELLQKEILERIGQLEGGRLAPVSPAQHTKRGIKWTGKIVNLSELIYGLFYTGQLNNGNVQLSEIVALFEQMFLVKIRDVHHTFGEIRERKVTSPSKFLDSMAVAIRDRVDEDLRYKPS